MTAAVENKLGGSAAVNAYKHRLYMLEDCYGNDCSWAAYAYFNRPLSVYKRDRNARSSPVQVHELG